MSEFALKFYPHEFDRKNPSSPDGHEQRMEFSRKSPSRRTIHIWRNTRDLNWVNIGTKETKDSVQDITFSPTDISDIMGTAVLLWRVTIADRSPII